MKEQVINLLKQGKSVKEIQSELNLSEWMWRKMGCNNIPKYKNIFNNIDETSAYWLGFLWADGSLSKNTLELEINSKDEDHLIKFKDLFIEINEPKIYRRCRNNAFTSRVAITCKNIAKSLRDLGFDLKGKRIIPNINKDLISHFIRGYFDGDGSCIIRNYNGNFEYRLDISGPLEFIDFIKPFLPENSNEEIIKNKTWISKRLYWYSKEKIIDVLKYLTDSETIKLERKYTPLLQ